MRFIAIIAFCLLAVCFVGCKKKSTVQQQQTTTTPPALTSPSQVTGYNLLSKINGIWNGPVVSETALGSYPMWIVDFRPISAGQVSAKNELDTANSIFMSFFICYYDSAYRLAFRNGGTFNNMYRISYMVVDSVSETAQQSFYRFADFKKGTKRDILDVIFKPDSLILLAFTNQLNAEPEPTPHMQWHAALQDTSSCLAAISHFNFPQPVLVKDLSTVFAADSETVFYQATGDPYPTTAQPYVGQATLSYTSNYTLNPNNHVFLIATTQPLISGTTVNMRNISRYVILDAYQSSYTFNLMHPGNYYLYAWYDANGNGAPDHGDYISANGTTFTLSPASTVMATANIDFQIP